MAKARVLIIDDEEYNLDAIERLLRKSFDVFRAQNGKEALKILSENDIDTILSDQRMPEMTGIEVLKQSIKIQPNASRILLTGYTDLDSVIDAINEAKIHLYLTKPWDNNQLKLSVEQACSTSQMKKEIEKKNIELQTANRELKTLDEAKSNFMIMINHELKTPLTTISSYLQLLSEDANEEQVKLLGGIQKGYDRLEKLIRLSLIITESQTDQIKISKEKLDMELMVDACLNHLKEEIDKKALQIRFKFSDEKLYVDKKLFDILTFELLENAIRYSKQGGGIEIQWDGKTFAITNEGKIPNDKVEKIFQAFYVDKSIMNHSNSTGLGISVCQAILKVRSSNLNLDQKDGSITFHYNI